MSSSTGIKYNLSNTFKTNGLFITAIILFVCCSFISCKTNEIDQLSEHQLIDAYYPSYLFEDDANVFERAAPRLGRASPRLGRASPRLGRASPRLGRRTAALLLSQLYHPSQYHTANDGAFTNDHYEGESASEEKRAAPRLGRAT